MIILIFICMLVLLIFIYYKNKNYREKLEVSINNFLDCIEKKLQIAKVTNDREFSFKRVIKYHGKIIPLGKVIFDDKNKQIFIYETFIYQGNKLVCTPDIRNVKYKDIIECNFYANNEAISYSSDLRKRKDIAIRIRVLHNYYDYINLNYFSVKDYDVLENLYFAFNKIIDNNKK